MSKKDKLGLDKIVNRFNKEFEKTSSQFNKLVNDAFKQFESLQNQVQDPIKKIMDDLDKLRDKEMNRFQSELDKRMSEFQSLQSQLLEKLGIDKATPAPKKAPKSAAKSTPKKSAPVTAKTTPAPAKTAAKPKISDIKGIGPATLKKLKESGIIEVSQVAKPNQEERKTLESFNKVRGFETWQDQATKLLAK